MNYLSVVGPYLQYVGTEWKHEKNGRRYKIDDVTAHQDSDHGFLDDVAVFVYFDAINTGFTFTRGCREFLDGRFTREEDGIDSERR